MTGKQVSRWLNWRPPSAPISAHAAANEPTKATEGASVGSVGSPRGEKQKMEASEVIAMLNGAGVRRLPNSLGIPRQTDGPQLRAAIEATPYGSWPVILIDPPTEDAETGTRARVMDFEEER